MPQFNKDHPRSINIRKNIIGLFLVKGGNIVIYLLLVPLTLHYLDKTRYGIWLTLNSVAAWFVFFDIGLDKSLRNKFAEANALGQKELARTYVSTTYAILSMIVGGLILLFLLVNSFLNWTKILNTPPGMASELSKLVVIVFVFICLKFVLKLITTILTADQKPAKAGLIELVGNGIALLVIFILTRTTQGNLIYLGTVLCSSPVIVLAIFSLWFYNREYRYYAPSFKFIDFSHAKDVMDLGYKFFLIQTSWLVLYGTDRIIITQLFGPGEVVTYFVAYNYFLIPNIIFTTISFPYWSSISEAYHKQDMLWIKNEMKTLNRTSLIFNLFVIVMMFFCNIAYYVWLGKSIQIPLIVSVLMGVYFMVTIFTAPFNYFAFGTGKVKLNLILNGIGALANIPVTIIFAKYFGISGVIIGNLICILPCTIFIAIQYRKVINEKALGIWNQ